MCNNSFHLHSCLAKEIIYVHFTDAKTEAAARLSDFSTQSHKHSKQRGRDLKQQQGREPQPTCFHHAIPPCPSQQVWPSIHLILSPQALALPPVKWEECGLCASLDYLRSQEEDKILHELRKGPWKNMKPPPLPLALTVLQETVGTPAPHCPFTQLVSKPPPPLQRVGASVLCVTPSVTGTQLRPRQSIATFSTSSC